MFRSAMSPLNRARCWKYLQLMSGRVKGRPIRRQRHADDMPCALMGDPRRIRQVITNLLSNALRFTDEGYIILRSRTDGEWLVEVEDSGCGIDPRNWQKSSSHCAGKRQTRRHRAGTDYQ